MNGFAKFHINEKLLEKLSSRGITSPTPIQNEAIPKILISLLSENVHSN